MNPHAIAAGLVIAAAAITLVLYIMTIPDRGPRQNDRETMR